MDIFITPFTSNTFMVNALIAGILVSIACGVIGTFIVLRGLAFIGDALAHGVLPGIALALLLGFPGILGATVGAVVMIGGISLITRRTRLTSDTAIGLLFVGMLALGVVIVSRSSSFSGDLVRVLFGEILGINPSALMVQLAATVIILITVTICVAPVPYVVLQPRASTGGWFFSQLVSQHHAGVDRIDGDHLLSNGGHLAGVRYAACARRRRRTDCPAGTNHDGLGCDFRFNFSLFRSASELSFQPGCRSLDCFSRYPDLLHCFLAPQST